MQHFNILYLMRK